MPTRRPGLIAVAVVLPVLLVVGVIVAAVVAGRSPAREPIALGPVPAPTAGSPECAALMRDLPADLGDYTRAELASPAPPATDAWQRDDSADQIVLRCGLDRPQEFNRASPLQLVNNVQWFEVSGAAAGIDASTWFAVDRGVYVALTVPKGSGPTPIQSVSDTITATIPAKPIDPGPL